jgi:hypothetical protein
MNDLVREAVTRTTQRPRDRRDLHEIRSRTSDERYQRRHCDAVMVILDGATQTRR